MINSADAKTNPLRDEPKHCGTPVPLEVTFEESSKITRGELKRKENTGANIAPNYCKHVGWSGSFLILLCLAIGALFWGLCTLTLCLRNGHVNWCGYFLSLAALTF